MLYYQKNEMIFYKLDETEKSFIEVFNNGSSQFRIMEINDSTIFDQVMERINTYSFQICTQQQFENKLAQTKSRF